MDREEKEKYISELQVFVRSLSSSELYDNVVDSLIIQPRGSWFGPYVERSINFNSSENNMINNISSDLFKTQTLEYLAHLGEVVKVNKNASVCRKIESYIIGLGETIGFSSSKIS